MKKLLLTAVLVGVFSSGNCFAESEYEKKLNSCIEASIEQNIELPCKYEDPSEFFEGFPGGRVIKRPPYFTRTKYKELYDRQKREQINASWSMFLDNKLKDNKEPIKIIEISKNSEQEPSIKNGNNKE